MAKGFGGVPGNMQALVRQAQQMQEKLKKAQEGTKTIEIEGSAGGGEVKIIASGENKLVSVTISKELVASGDVNMIQDLIVLAANDALSKVQEQVQGELGKITGGLNIPGMF